MKTGQVGTVGTRDAKERRRSRMWQKAALVVMALVPVLLTNGCAGLVGQKTQASGTASFTVSPTTINFGKVTAGQKSTQNLTLTNTGSMAVTIQQVTSSSAQFGVSGITLPMTMSSGQSTTLAVWVNGTTSGAVSGTLTIQGDSGATPGVVNLSGTIATNQPQISVSPGSVDFGNVTVGQKGTANLVISNTGGADLTVSVITLNGTEFGISGIATPKTISAGQSVPVVASFAPTTAGTVSGSIAITSNDPNTPTTTIGLGGTGTAATLGQLTASPTSLSFSSVSIGSNATQNVTLTNTGTVAVHITSISAAGSGFSVSGLTAPVTLNATEKATMAVKFAPSATGNATGSITVASDAAGSPLTIALSGTATTAPVGQLTASTNSLSFGTVAVGSSTSQNVTLTNTGNASLQITGVTEVGAGFSVSGVTAPLTLNASQTATLAVKFAPSTTGNATGSITVANDAGASITISLSGTATAAPVGQLTASSNSLSFGSLALGTNASQNITLTNTGTAALQITSVSESGTGFSVSGVTAPLTLNASQTATLAVKFAPSVTGNATGSITVANNVGASITISLSGTATAAPVGQLTASTNSLSYGSVAVGSNASQNITLTNTGTAALQITSVSESGAGFSVSGVTAPLTLNASETATLAVKFAPSVTGNATGSITVANNVGASVTISLSGTATAAPVGQLTASTNSLSYGSVAVGSNASQNITLTNTGTAALQITSVSESGAGFSVSGVTAPLTLNASETATLAVKFAPGVAGNATGSITVANNAGASVTVALSGTGTQAGLSVSPATFNFGSVVDGQTISQNFTLTNTGTATLTVTQISVSGASFSASGLTTPTTIGAGSSASFSLQFAPTTAGTLGGSVSIASNAPSSPNVVSVSGTGLAASVTISPSPSSVSFGSVNSGSSSSKSVTITNSGNANVTISQVSVSAKDMSASGISSGMTLTPGQNAAMNVTFNPSTSETVTGSVTVSTTQGSSAVIPVSGSGVQAAITLTPSSVSFGNVTIGSPNSQTIQISNSGTAVLTVTQVSVSGSGFLTSSLALPLSINPGAASTFNVQFGPQSAGSVTGSVSLVSNAPNSPSTVSLSGTGIASVATISLSATSLNFGSVTTGTSAQQSVTITNTGNADVTISQINIGGTGYTLTGGGSPVTLTPNQTMTITVHFSPTSAGTDSGSVSIVSNAVGSPLTIPLSGIATAPVTHSVALNWTASTSTVSGYNVYRSTTSGSGYTKVNPSLVGGVSYSDTSVANGTTYYYVTTAVDGSGNESSYSNEAQAIIP